MVATESAVVEITRGARGATKASPSPTGLALVRAVAAADDACRRLPAEAPEREAWLRHSGRLVHGLSRMLASAEPRIHAAISAQLDDITEASNDGPEQVRRLIMLAKHGRDYAWICEDPRIPAAVRERASSLPFRLFDEVARVRRAPEIADLARRRNEIFAELGLAPRSATLLDWCDVAVRIALGSPLRETLASQSPERAERLLAAKVRFDLLAIELNIALDDVADAGRDAGLLVATVLRSLGSHFAARSLRADTAVGAYFLEQLEQAEAGLAADESSPQARYIELVADLYREVLGAGQALAGDRWDDSTWNAQIGRIIRAMLLSLVQNQRPDLLAEGAWSRLHGPDRLAIQAANSNRVIFELVGLWCHERVTGKSVAKRDRLLAAFEDLQIAQQLSNCLATLDREIDEGDRSNSVVDQAVATWRGRSELARTALVVEAGLAAPLRMLSVSAATDGLVGELYEIVRAAGSDRERGLAARCIRGIVEATGAVGDVLAHWQRRVDAAAQTLDSLGYCGTSSRTAQIDLLLMHLLLLRKSPLADATERH